MKPRVTVAPAYRFTRARARFVTLTDRLGKRLRLWERQLEAKERDAEAAARAAGEPFMVSLPPVEFVETYKAYRAGMAALLADERDREKLLLASRSNNQPQPLTDEELQQGLQDLARETLATLSEAELEHALEQRRQRKGDDN